MHFYKQGTKRKPALIILHGWGIDGSNYNKLAGLLAKDFYVLAPDLPGFGATPAPEKSYDVKDYADAVKELINEQNLKKVYLLGHSFGGRISIKLASHYTELVKGIVLTGVPGIERFNWKRSLRRGIYWTAAKGLKIFGFLPPIKKLKKKFYANKDFGKLEGIMKETFLKVIKEDLSKEAKNISCKTLLLWGAKDQMAPVIDAEKILKIIPQSNLKIFTKVGHKLHYEKAHEFAREVTNFLKK